MSTRSTTWITDSYSGAFVPVAGQALEGYAPEARIYRHYDGYPAGHGCDLQRFFAAVEAQTGDTRYGDASYLAAKLVVFLASEFADTMDAPLAFSGVGIIARDPGDIAYVYVIDCATMDDEGRPSVRCFSVVHRDRDLSLGSEQAIPAAVKEGGEVA